MKVWVLSHAYVAAVNRDKLAALAALPGLDLTLMAPARWPTAFGVARLAAHGARYRVVPSRVLLGGRLGAYLYLDGWPALLRARPDILHAEVEPWSLAALQCVLLARGARLVLFTWENLDGPPRGWQRALERFTLRRVAFVIAGNEAARARMLRLGVPAGRVAVLPQFGVDPERYAGGDPARLRHRLSPAGPLPDPIVGYVGRLVPEKAVEVLVEALAPLDARLLVVGDGPSRPELERRTAGWPQGKVCFAGAADHAAIPDYLAAMDVLVLPSRTTARWAEQFGHVLIEAMAAGVPVVGSSSGAIPEVIGDAGLVFPEDSVPDLRDCLARLLADKQLRASLAERGRARVRRHYAHEVVARSQHDIYARLLRG